MASPGNFQASSTFASSVSPHRFTLAVGIPTRGRAAILKETLADLGRQSRPPEAIFVTYIEASDIGDAPELFPQVRFVKGSGGSCEQRNHLLDAAGDGFDLIFIQDDDFFAQRDYLLRVEQVFAADPRAVALTGRILSNGATGPGYTVEYARKKLAAIAAAPTVDQEPPFPHFNTDGCNMAFRLGVIRREGIRFDEQMPGYAWYEDIDFSRRLLPFGVILMVPSAQGIHLGAKVGKTSGRRFGYSQVANPIYLARKGTFPWFNAVRSVLRNLLANVVRSLAPEAYVDRRGRLSGNLSGLRDLWNGKLHPGRILQMD